MISFSLSKAPGRSCPSSSIYSDTRTLPDPAPNFISEVFFLTAQYLHIGTMHAIKEHKGISEQISHMNRQLREMEADSSWRGTPAEAQALNAIDRYKVSNEPCHPLREKSRVK